MILYRIYTEDKNRDEIEQRVSQNTVGYTVLTGTGYWKGDREACLIIEVLGGETRDNVLQIAAWIKEHNEQDSVAVIEQEVKTYVIGESL